MNRWAHKVALLTGANSGIGAALAERLVEAGVKGTDFFTMNQWENKVALVTGANSGIGAAIVERLVDAGVKVAGLSRRKDRLDALAKNLEGRKGEFYSIGCDVTKEEELLKAFQWIKDKVGPISILVNSAGCQKSTSLIEGDTKLWKEMLDTNVLGLCTATREAVKDMRANNTDGHIIHLNSFSGHRVANLPRASVYPASKFAVTALTETLRQELNTIQSKIKITSVSPGFVDTEFLDILGVSRVHECGSKRPMLQASDVADAIIYALSTPPHVQVHEIKMRAVGQVH